MTDGLGIKGLVKRVARAVWFAQAHHRIDKLLGELEQQSGGRKQAENVLQGLLNCWARGDGVDPVAGARLWKGLVGLQLLRLELRWLPGTLVDIFKRYRIDPATGEWTGQRETPLTTPRNEAGAHRHRVEKSELRGQLEAGSSVERKREGAAGGDTAEPLVALLEAIGEKQQTPAHEAAVFRLKVDSSRNFAHDAPLERLLSESDAPYLGHRVQTPMMTSEAASVIFAVTPTKKQPLERAIARRNHQNECVDVMAFGARREKAAAWNRWRHGSLVWLAGEAGNVAPGSRGSGMDVGALARTKERDGLGRVAARRPNRCVRAGAQHSRLTLL